MRNRFKLSVLAIAVLAMSIMLAWSAFPETSYAGGIISAFAGTGTSGYSGDTGAATAAKLDNPYGVSADTSGNIFIADSTNNRIRKVDTSGNISTFAGNGTAGYSGDGGAATAAKLNNPSGVYADTSGNIFIADTGNNRIRRVDTSGKIITVAGNGTGSYSGDSGPATAAMLDNPKGVYADSSGNIFIADFFNDRIRRVDTSGTISTFAGNGTYGYSGDGGLATATKLAGPSGVSADSSGNIFIADSGNYRIRRVDTSGYISTFAGTGAWGYSGDGGLATAAQLDSPSGVYADTSGNLFIADTYNDSIRRVDKATGNISTVAGTGTPGYSGDGGLATAAKFYSPTGVSADTSGNLFIADRYNHSIRKVVFNAAPTATGVSITGTLKIGSTLTGTYAYSDAESNPEGVSTFKWYTATDATCTTGKAAIGSATSSTYTLTAAEVGKYVCFGVTPVATAGTLTGSEVITTSTGVIAADAAPVAGSVNITGTLKIGITLTGTYTYSDAESNPEGVSTFKWYTATDATCTTAKAAIGSATSSTYTLTASEVGSYVCFGVTPVATAGTLTGSEVITTSTGVIASNAAPVAGSVSITGTLKIGITLTGTYTYSDAESNPEGVSTFKWYTATDATCTTAKAAIAGATSSTYTLTAAEVGNYVCFGVTPVATAGTSPGTEVITTSTGVIASNAAPVAGSVNISGTLVVGQTLTGNYTYSDAENDTEGTSAFKWYTATDNTCTAGKTAIGGAVAKPYTLTAGEVGRYVCFGVTPVASTGTSPGTEVIKTTTGTVSTNAAPTATGVGINGTAATGQTLTGIYTYSDAEGNPEGTSAFKWYTATDNTCTAGKTAIVGAAAISYTLTSGEVGRYVCFGVTPVATAGTSPGTEVIATGSTAVSATPVITAGVTLTGISNITGSTVLATGNATGTGIGERGFYWWIPPTAATHFGGSESGLIPEGYGAGSFSLTVTGLKPGNTYHLKTYVKVGGQIITSDEQLFTTPTTGATGKAAPTVLTDTKNFTVSGSSITVNGEITDIGSSAVNVYGFVYAPHTAPFTGDDMPKTGDRAYAMWDRTPLYQGMKFTGTIKNIPPGKWYLRTYAHNMNQDSSVYQPDSLGYGEEISFTIACTPETCIPGDVNGDGKISLDDAMLVLRILSGIPVGNVNLNADVNGDGKIGLEELGYILQKVAELRPSGT